MTEPEVARRGSATEGGVADLAVGSEPVVVVAILAMGFVLAWRFLPVGIDVSLTAFVVSVGLVVGASLVSATYRCSAVTHSRFASLARPAPRATPDRARDLVGLEQAVASTMSYEHDLYLKLRPELRFIAEARLRCRGIELDSDPRAPEVLGDLHDLVRSEATRPGRLFGPGIPLAALEQLVDRLEQS